MKKKKRPNLVFFPPRLKEDRLKIVELVQLVCSNFRCLAAEMPGITASISRRSTYNYQ